jgi:transcription termination factor NusB
MNSFRSDMKTHVSLLTQISNSIQLKISEILVDTQNSRFKRGLINGVGSIFKALTGNLDASDGEYFTQAIDKITHDQHQIENLLKNQISVTSSVITTFNETIRKLQIDEETFNKDLKNIDIGIHMLDDQVKLVDTKLKFLEICEKLMESYLFLEDNVNDILNAITFARLKIIHSSIITPQELLESLEQISRNLVRNNLPLPAKISEIAQYLEIIELEAFQTQNDVIYFLFPFLIIELDCITCCPFHKNTLREMMIL